MMTGIAGVLQTPSASGGLSSSRIEVIDVQKTSKRKKQCTMRAWTALTDGQLTYKCKSNLSLSCCRSLCSEVVIADAVEGVVFDSFSHAILDAIRASVAAAACPILRRKDGLLSDAACAAVGSWATEYVRLRLMAIIILFLDVVMGSYSDSS